MSAHEMPNPSETAENSSPTEPTCSPLIELLLSGEVRSRCELEAHCAFAGVVPNLETAEELHGIKEWCGQMFTATAGGREYVAEMLFEVAMHRGVRPAVRRAAVEHLSPTVRLMFAAELLGPCYPERCDGERDAMSDDAVARTVIDLLSDPDGIDAGLIPLVCRLRPNVLRMLDALVDAENPEGWQCELAEIVSGLMYPGVALAELAWKEARRIAERDLRPLVRLASNPYHPYGESAALEYEQRRGASGLGRHIPESELRDTLDLEIERFFGPDGGSAAAERPSAETTFSEALRLHLLWASGLAEQLVMGGELSECGRDLVSLNLALMLDRDGDAQRSIAVIGEHASFEPGSELLGLNSFESAAAVHLPLLEPMPSHQLIMPTLDSRYDRVPTLRPLISVLSYPYPVLAALLPDQVLADLVATVTEGCAIWIGDAWGTLERLVENAPGVPFMQLIELASYCHLES